MFGRRKKEKSFTDELEAQPVQPATPPGQAPSPPPEPPRVGDGNAVVVQGGTIEIPGGGGRSEFPQGATIVDARGVQGLRGEMLKAVEDMRAGKSAGPEELKAVIAKAMDVRNAYLAQAGMASPDGTVAGAPGAPAASTPPAAPAPEDPLDRLERLNNLRLAGTLTDAEFEEQKKKILGEM